MSPAPPIKRPAPTPPTPSHSQSSSTRPTKRVRRSASPVASTSALPPPAAPPAPLAAPTKRVVREGTLRRLALPRVKNPAVLARSTLSGAKIGGRSKDLKRPQAGEEGQLLEGDEEEIWVGRKGGMSFGGWLKRGVAAFVQRGAKVVSVHAMGAAIPMALSVALAVRDAVPGGADALTLETFTDTITVNDEVTPTDQDEDIVYQSRLKSTVTVVLSSRPDAHAGMNPARPRTGAADRGGRQRGGRGRGRGRGM